MATNYGLHGLLHDWVSFISFRHDGHAGSPISPGISYARQPAWCSSSRASLMAVVSMYSIRSQLTHSAFTTFARWRFSGFMVKVFSMLQLQSALEALCVSPCAVDLRIGAQD